MVVGVCAASPATAAAAGCSGSHWVGVWAASPGRAPGGSELSDQTLRLTVTPHRGGRLLRLRLGNRFGTGALRVDAVRVGIRRSGASVRRGTARTVRFGGARAVAVRPGSEVTSDAVRLRFRAFQDLAVSAYVRGSSGPVTQHDLASQTSYLTPAGRGDHTADRSGKAFSQTITSWPLLEGVDARAGRGVGAVVAFGDSITDVGELDRSARYPDLLARRLLRARDDLSVLNAGIGGNRLLGDALAPGFGPRGLARLRADALDLPGASDVIVMEGINDIGGQRRSASARRLIAGLAAVARRARARGVGVHLGTLTPAGGTGVLSYGTPAAERIRNRVNSWIRRTRLADSVADFDRAVRDPRDRNRIAARYDSGDHLHPNTAGHRAMARVVRLRSLRGGCGRGRS